MIAVHLVFRKPIVEEYFSIERLFARVRECLPPDQFEVTWHTCPWYSTGLLNRLKALAWVRRIGPGLVHVTGDVNFLALAVPKRRLVVTFHDLTTLNRLRGWRRWLFRKLWVEGPALRAARLAFVSEANRSETLLEVPEIVRGKTRVIPNCFTEPRDPKPRPFPEYFPTVLCVGTRPHKNLPRIFAALRDLPVRLCVVGPLAEEYKACLNALGLSWQNHVALSDEEMRDQYRRSDLVAFVPTYEGFGLPILEAQAMGRPLVTSRREPMQWVAGEGACLADPESVEDIRSAILRLITDRAYRDEVVEAGSRNLERFSPHAAAIEYANLYRAVWDSRNA